MSGDAIVKSFIDRILRLKEEQDALAADIREVYAEAKGNGHDKTAMGEVVAYLRKIDKKGKDAVEERGAMFDLYLDAYQRAGASHTHAPARVHGNIEQFDAETGEVIQNTPDTHTPQVDGGRPETSSDAMPSGQGGEEPGIHRGKSEHQTASAAQDRNEPVSASEASATNSHSSADRGPRGPQTDKADEAVTSPAVSSVDLSDDDVPAFLKAHKPMRPYCLNPDLCGGSGTKHCYSCLKARDDATVAA